MDIHKPKPAKNLREFAVEIGTIVVGILIALGLEQAVESAREHRAVAEAREAVRGEIAQNLGGMLVRREGQACIDRRLDELGTILDAAQQNRPYAAPQWVGRPSTWPMQARRWIASSQAGRASLFPSQEQSDYAGAYYSSDQYGALEDQEQMTWATLRGMRGLRAMSPEVAVGFSQALEQARYENWRLKLTTERLEDEVRLLKIPTQVLVPTKRSLVPSTCVPIGTERQAALAMIGNPFGEP